MQRYRIALHFAHLHARKKNTQLEKRNKEFSDIKHLYLHIHLSRLEISSSSHHSTSNVNKIEHFLGIGITEFQRFLFYL